MSNWKLVAFDRNIMSIQKETYVNGVRIQETAVAYNHPTMWDYYKLDRMDVNTIRRALSIDNIQETEIKAITEDAIKYLTQ